MRSGTLTSILLGAAILGAVLAPQLPGLLRHDGDAQPTPPRPVEAGDGSLTLRAELDHGVVARGQASEVNLVIEVTAAGAGSMDAHSPPVHVALVLDTSGSMVEDDRMGTARRAANALASRLRPQDSLALVTFDDQAWLRLPRGPVLNPGLFQDVVAGLSPGGGTNLYDGLERGYRELDQAGLEGVRRVVLLSDGVANIGVTEPEQIRALAAQQADRGVGLSALGVGVEFNEDLLASLADMGGGRYAFADRDGELERAFTSEVETLARTVAREAVLEVRLAQGDQVVRLYGYGSEQISPDQGGFQVFLGDLGDRQRRRVVARVRLGPSDEAERVTARTRLRYHDATSDQGVTDEGEVRVKTSELDADLSGGLRAEEARTAALAEAASAMEESAEQWTQGQIDEARETLRRAMDALSSAPTGGAPAPAMPELEEQLQQLDAAADGASRRRAVIQAKEAARVYTR